MGHENPFGRTERLGVAGTARLLWQGDWSTGKKATPVLRIVEKGKQAEIIALKQLEVSVIKDGHYSLTFGSDDREGELVLAK